LGDYKVKGNKAKCILSASIFSPVHCDHWQSYFRRLCLACHLPLPVFFSSIVGKKSQVPVKYHWSLVSSHLSSFSQTAEVWPMLNQLGFTIKSVPLVLIRVPLSGFSPVVVHFSGVAKSRIRDICARWVLPTPGHVDERSRPGRHWYLRKQRSGGSRSKASLGK
jgi:hypothetical protein